jgi:hypothetical protein
MKYEKTVQIRNLKQFSKMAFCKDREYDLIRSRPHSEFSYQPTPSGPFLASSTALGWLTLGVECLFAGAGGVPGAQRATRRNRRCVLSSPALRTRCRNPWGKAAKSFSDRFWRGHRTTRGQRSPRRCEIRSWDNQAHLWASSLPSSSWSLLRAGCRMRSGGRLRFAGLICPNSRGRVNSGAGLPSNSGELRILA